MQGIYEIRNTENGAVYVGQSVDTEKRMYGHRLALTGDRHPNKLLQEEWNDCGEEVFTFEHVETVYREALLFSKETKRIRDYEKDNAKLYNRTVVHKIRRKPPKKTVLFDPFQEHRRKPLVLKHLTFRDRPAPPIEVTSKSVTEKPKPKPKKKLLKQKRARKQTQKKAQTKKTPRKKALKETRPIKPPKTERGCPHHPGIICWHMVIYGSYNRRCEGMTFAEYEESRT